MRYRLRAAWHVLRGKPTAYGLTSTTRHPLALGDSRGLLVSNCTVRDSDYAGIFIGLGDRAGVSLTRDA